MPCCADGLALPVCELGPIKLSRVLFALREGEQRCLGPARPRLDVRITSPSSGRVEEMVGSSCQHGRASLQLSAHTAFLAQCAVPSRQGRSESLGLLVGPLRSVSCAKSPRPSKTTWKLPQLPSRKPASLATASQPHQATFTSSLCPHLCKFYLQQGVL